MEQTPLLSNTDLLENMNTYERSLEENTSYDVVRRLDMTTAYGAGARNVRDAYEASRSSDLSTIKELKEALQVFVDHEVDYMTRNNLGDPEAQQRIKDARELLTRLK